MKLQYAYEEGPKQHTIEAVDTEGRRLMSVSMSEYRGVHRTQKQVIADSFKAAIKLVNELNEEDNHE